MGQFVIPNSKSLGDTTREVQLLHDGTTHRMIAGYQDGGFDDGNFGFKISRTGYDVLEASDDELIMSSSFNLFKIVETNTMTITGNGLVGGAVTATRAHNLGFIPAHVGYVVGISSGFSSLLPWIEYGINVGTQRIEIISLVQLTVDSQNIVLYMENGPASSATITVRYYLLRETAN